MKNYFVLYLFITLLLGCGAGKNSQADLAVNSPIVVNMNLTNVANDQGPVIVNPGRIAKDTLIYRLPRIVQGTYAVSDFGNYIENLRAIDYKGNELQSTKLDTNTWQIINAEELDYIEYLVNDTFDVEREVENAPFSPAGTNIEEENFVLNLHGFIGYFDSLKNNSYTLTISSPTSFKRTSALTTVASIVSEDSTITTPTYNAPRYFDITDNPMMYGNLDVEEFMVGDIKIVLSLYSPNQLHSAESLKQTIFDMMKAQKDYLGDINSTSRYDIYLYLAENNDTAPTGFGALEHHTSTVVVLNESASKESLAKSMIDVVSHEFFHILTPLSVHSEDVHYFDYNQPTFSKHLWMYEGVTEYFAQHFQVYEKLVEPQEFYNSMMQKIMISKRLDDSMSFTEMSENILEEPFASNYYNVYQKGALIGMCLDILIREESNGERSLLSIMKELSKRYGMDKPFNDDSLINEIASLTYPSVNEFFENHVIGNTPIDYNTFFEKVGLTIAEAEIETNFIRGKNSFIFRADPANDIILFTDEVKNNSWWRDQGVQANDILKEVNGALVTMQNAQSILGEIYQWKPDQDVEIKLLRNGEEVIIKTKLVKTYTVASTLKEDPNATDKQVATRKDWLDLSTIE